MCYALLSQQMIQDPRRPDATPVDLGGSNLRLSSDAIREIKEELARIIESPAFKTSRRSRHFLEYVVGRTLEGSEEDLKERSIGVAVFDRRPDYDTGGDATVRVAANEVRKRLAQYHGDAPTARVRIDLPPGSYHPEIRFPQDESVQPHPVPAPDSGRVEDSRRYKTLVPILLLAGLLGVAGFLMLRSTASTAFDRFWEPVFRSSKPVLICIGNPLAYVPAANMDLPSENYPPASSDLIPSRDQFVGIGDAYAVALFTRMISERGRQTIPRADAHMNFSDLRSSPSVLIGAYSNRWTMQSNAEYRFAFGRFSVVDHQDPKRVWRLSSVSPDYKSTEDYAIVSRVLRSYSGEAVVTAAGITNMGTHAAAEFLTNPEYLNAALTSAPDGWEQKNLQIVIYCKVIGNTPGPPRILAIHYW
jgi:hypothetical protein